MIAFLCKFLPDFIVNFLGKINTIKTKPTGYVFKMWEHSTWGNRIEFLNWDQRTISGHYLNRLLASSRKYKIDVGDELQCKMETGKIGRFLVTEIKYESNPPDMFFGKVKDLGYTNE